jgi:hypothetical protein
MAMMAAISPIPMPIETGSIALDQISQHICPGLAPKAIRIPISRVCRATA